jgi:anti-sigma factor RsiW
MANERNRRLMQEALDDNLSPEARQQLFEELNQNPNESAEYSRLRQVDAILRTAPFEHAPKRMALAIMARLAEGVKRQPGISGLALALGLALVTLVATPLLLAAGWLALNAIASAAILGEILKQLVNLLTTLLGALQIFVNEAQTIVSTNPQAPALAAALVALALAGLAGYAYYSKRS